MLSPKILQRLLLVGCCLRLYGNPVHPPDIKLEGDGDCYGLCTGLPPNTSSVQEWKAKAGGGGGERGGGGGANPNAPPEGRSWPPQTAKRGAANAGTGPGQVGGDREGKVGSNEEAPATSPPGGHSLTAGPQSSSISSSRSAGGSSEEEGVEPPRAPLQDEPPGPTLEEGAHTPSASSPHSPVPPMVFVSIQTSTPQPSWGHEAPPTLSVQEPLLPDIGADLMPREDGPESLWTEATRPGVSKSEKKIKKSIYPSIQTFPSRCCLFFFFLIEMTCLCASLFKFSFPKHFFSSCGLIYSFQFHTH